ncbi:MAG TPA: MotA/TolQ/ExbB proton channel family protein [Blastocatellia bacterium]|nr:MotA/TolQ/ExbB proton channel family protein [Blastocatellia bacterium]
MALFSDSSVTLLVLSWLQTESALAFTWSIHKLWEDLSVAGIAVIVVLLLMSIYSVAVMLERYLTFKSAAAQSRVFVPKVSAMLKEAHLAEALQLSREYKKSHLAMVVNSGLQELTATNGKNPLRKAKRAVKRAAAMKTADLQRGLSSLATVGSTAPFVGLFGTVVGIINAFTKMNEAQSAGIAVISGAIAEALITTAFGLVVAIPAVWMFNYFTNRVNVFAIEMHNSAEELIDYFLQQQPEN